MTALSLFCVEYAYSDLLRATDGFNPQTRLGTGSFATVFHGTQKDGTDIAIKVLDVPEEAGFEEEVRVLSKFRHPNLVILMGFAKNGPQRLLVYEHLGGGDVFRRIQRCQDPAMHGYQAFTWRQRIGAAFDAACGLSHLHNCTPKVFHRDIKSPNILLDHNGTAKMADFGLACCSHAKEQKVAQAAGTVGYACPHYVEKGVVTEGSEVYSFGIVLLELLTAMQPAKLTQGPDGNHYDFLVTYLNSEVRIAVSSCDKTALWPPEAASQFAALGLKCTQYQEEGRPFFTEVVATLRSLRNLQEPEAPPSPTLPFPPKGPSGGYQNGYQNPNGHQHGHQNGYPNGQSNGQPNSQQNGHQNGHQNGYQSQQAQAVQALRAQQALQAQQAWQAQQLWQAQQALQAPQVLTAPPALSQARRPPRPEEDRHVQRQATMPLAEVPMPPTQRQASMPLADPELFSGGRASVRVSIHRPLLWSLECVMSQCAKLELLPKEQKVLLHGGHTLTMRFGRLFQDDFCRTMLPVDHYFSQVSREHFQIWAQEWIPLPDLAQSGGQPCSFRLTNYAAAGTAVDGVVLQTRGQQAPLHDGSIIGVLGRVITNGFEEKVPFLEFRFSLEGSSLADADALWETALRRTRSPETVSCEAPRTPEVEGFGVQVPAGVSFVGDDVEPVFVLEVHGSGVRANAGHDHLVHGPKASACAAAPGCEAPCPPLVLGKEQAGFWRRILNDEAFGLLEPQHLMLEVEEAAERRFFLRNLSQQPVRVEGPPEDGYELHRDLEDGRWQLYHGDTILLELSKGTSIWMAFRELPAPTKP